ncbi:MAG: polysaccharide deacetylase family protein [Candidatus Krumholzibacteriota bacterium]|nr:polysaccharide deacetylase family protein [Candidatus Krumholzibacteriota bacterium]
MSLFLLILSVLSFLVILSYLLWKTRWGLPPDDFPRVLAYHKVTDFELGGTWISPARFASQIDRLLDLGFSFLGEDDFLAVLEGRRTGNRKEILLTFDDGYREFLFNAAPILKKRNISALIFIITSYTGKYNDWELNLPWRRFKHLSWDEIKELSDMGFSFGSHAMSHRDLTGLSKEELRDELTFSKRILDKNTGEEIKCLSYPFGKVNSGVSEAARRAGYRAAFSICPPSLNSRIDPFALRREGVYVIDNIFSLKNKLSYGKLFWVEDLKGRFINGVSALTPLIKR